MMATHMGTRMVHICKGWTAYSRDNKAKPRISAAINGAWQYSTTPQFSQEGLPSTTYTSQVPIIIAIAKIAINTIVIKNVRMTVI